MFFNVLFRNIIVLVSYAWAMSWFIGFLRFRFAENGFWTVKNRALLEQARRPRNKPAHLYTTRHVGIACDVALKFVINEFYCTWMP